MGVVKPKPKLYRVQLYLPEGEYSRLVEAARNDARKPARAAVLLMLRGLSEYERDGSLLVQEYDDDRGVKRR